MTDGIFHPHGLNGEFILKCGNGHSAFVNLFTKTGEILLKLIVV